MAPAVREWDFQLFPKPVEDQLTITLPTATGPVDLRILDAVGRTIHQQQLNSTTADVDLEALPAGSYRCVLETVQGRQVKGFVKE